MRRLPLLLLGLAAGLLVAGCGGTTTVTVTETETVTLEETVDDRGDILVVYDDPATEDDELVQGLIRETGLFEAVAEALNELLALPDDITIFVTGGEDGPYYDPSKRVIVMNTGFANYIASLYSDLEGDELRQTLVEVEVFVLLHELGHAIVDVLEIPVLGKEEDAVDGFATLVMTEGDVGEVALTSADFWQLSQEQRGEFEEADFWDEHSLDIQRAYAIACQVYGSNPERFAAIEEVIDDEERLARCTAEYEDIIEKWETVLLPYTK